MKIATPTFATFAQGDEMRPIFDWPKWDGKLVLAGLFIIGYYALVLIMAWRPLPTSNAALVHDAIATLGPVVGLIFGALFRITGAEERNAVLRSADLQAAITTPATPPAPEDVAKAVETGVTKALANNEPLAVAPTRPMAADGRLRPWLDGDAPGPTDPPSSVTADVVPGSTPVMGD